MKYGANRKMVRVPADAFSALLRMAAVGRSPEDAAERLRSMGVAAAPTFLSLLREGVGRTDLDSLPAGAFWREMSEMFSELGWGALREERLHPGVLALSSSDWFESAGASAAHPCCHFTTGLLAEIFRHVAGADLAAMEVGCRATGAHGCNFLIGGPEALEAVYAEMVEGGGYREAIASLG